MEILIPIVVFVAFGAFIAYRSRKTKSDGGNVSGGGNGGMDDRPPTQQQ